MESSLIPRPKSPTDAKRRAEANAREAERRSSARNASNSAIGSDGKLTLAGGIDVIGDGVVKVIGVGYTESGVPYEVSARLTSYENVGGYGTYESPALLFSSGIFGDAENARVWSRSGNEVQIDGRVPGHSSGSVSVGSGGPLVNYRSEDPALGGESRTSRVAVGDELTFKLFDTQAATEVGMEVKTYQDPTGTLHVGHFDWREDVFSRLRTKLGGWLSLESKAAGGASAVVMDGAGNIDLQYTGALTGNGTQISPGAPAWSAITGKPATFPPTIGTTATTAKAGNYTPTIAGVTGLQAALDGKAPAADVWKPKFKNVPTNLGAGPWAQNVYTSIGPAIAVPANPFGAGVPYKINFYGQAVCTLTTAGSFSAAQAKRNGAIFGSNVSNTARGASETVLVFVKFTVPVTDASASSLTFEWGPFFSTGTLDTAPARTYFEVEVTPYTAL